MESQKKYNAPADNSFNSQNKSPNSAASPVSVVKYIYMIVFIIFLLRLVPVFLNMGRVNYGAKRIMIASPCTRYKNISDCDGAANNRGESCAWYVCKNMCLTTGTDVSTVCNNDIQIIESAESSAPTKSPTGGQVSSVRLKPPKTKDEIGWETYNFHGYEKSTLDQKGKKFAFSFKFPNVGDYCNGCFDGWPYNLKPVNAQGVWINGSFYEGSLNDKWSLNVGAFYPNITKNEGFLYDEEIPIWVAKLESLNIGEVTDLSFSSHAGKSQKYHAVRIEDSTALNKKVKQYVLTDENNSQTRYALIDYPTYTIIIIYSFSDPTYDVFDRILNSFSTELYQKPYQGITMEEYLK